MNTTSASQLNSHNDPSLPLLERGLFAAQDFVARPASARPLAALRIGLSAVLILQALSLTADLNLLYGELGVVQWNVMDPQEGASVALPGVPRLRWLVDLLAPFGISAATSVRVGFVTYLMALSCLLFGWRTRLAAMLAWLTHLAMNTSGAMTIYGVDQFANIGLFYCLVMPVGHRWSLDAQAGRVSTSPSTEARIALRVLQIHLCIVYLASGIEKAAGMQWWDGEAVWRAVNLPELVSPLTFDWLASAPWLAAALAWGTLAVELGYAFLVWPHRTRRWMALATISLHAGIAVGMGLLSFAGVMIVLTTSAFLVPSEPTRNEAENQSPNREG